jgi:hypothetical protein
MIRIHITDEQGTLLGVTTLDPTDLTTRGDLSAEWVGRRVLEELPSNKEALHKLLATDNKED